MDHLTVEDLLSIAEEILGAPAVMDIGLLDSAAHRPRASVFGQDAYPSIHEKAAALLDAVSGTTRSLMATSGSAGRRRWSSTT